VPLHTSTQPTVLHFFIPLTQIYNRSCSIVMFRSSVASSASDPTVQKTRCLKYIKKREAVSKPRSSCEVYVSFNVFNQNRKVTNFSASLMEATTFYTEKRADTTWLKVVFFALITRQQDDTEQMTVLTLKYTSVRIITLRSNGCLHYSLLT
jgi:hypothetical protein